MSLIRNRAEPIGLELGEQLARMCDDAEPKARLKVPDLLPRCNSCAFHKGKHTANGSVTTTMDALKSVIEGIEFQCHEPHRAGAPCSGWAMMRLADNGVGVAPWKFSDESAAAAEKERERAAARCDPRQMSLLP